MENKKMDIVITMGGLGSRFEKVGYTIPKYQIEVHGKTLFEWSLISLRGYHSIVNQYIFIVREGHNAKEFIRKQCKKLKIQHYHIIEIDYLTDGQATTALLANKLWNSENSLLIYNIDTYVKPCEMNAEELKGDGFIPCF